MSNSNYFLMIFGVTFSIILIFYSLRQLLKKTTTIFILPNFEAKVSRRVYVLYYGTWIVIGVVQLLGILRLKYLADAGQMVIMPSNIVGQDDLDYISLFFSFSIASIFILMWLISVLPTTKKHIEVRKHGAVECGGSCYVKLFIFLIISSLLQVAIAVGINRQQYQFYILRAVIGIVTSCTFLLQHYMCKRLVQATHVPSEDTSEPYKYLPS